MSGILPKFTELNELASHRNGGRIVFATDDWFAEAENLLSDEEPVFKTDLYTDYGKWMDGWETRRRRSPGHDWCIVKLGTPGVVRGVDLDTAFFTGNFAPRVSIQAACLEEEVPERKREALGSACSKEELKRVEVLKSEEWTEILPMTELRAGYEDTRHNYFEISSKQAWTHLRLNMYPDGGIARLRVFGEARPTLPRAGQIIDLVSMKNGGVCKGYSNAHYGHPRNLIRPGAGLNMGDGWETARRLDRPAVLRTDPSGILKVPGNEWAIFRLADVGRISEIDVDTKHFKGNFPDSIRIEGALLRQSEEWDNPDLRIGWKTVLPTSKLSAHKVHHYTMEDLHAKGPFSHIKVTIAPDGGISRLRVYGVVTPVINV